ncbi:CaiB/BaiF CoA transferase family protein [Sphingobium estronivorans]|uniref:CaiB/BaiF CoA transferase family protein n=1 Tax=Sphingobium estronivorans TaxID=1577690 RepID=UPI00123BCE5F|nr:CaiB/BaiF CoA-transferase family protein [Sphingobium estronivorans]
MPGPLSGIRIVEMGGIGPGPFACMMLADHGAEVIRVERPGAYLDVKDPLLRSRTIVTIDMKSAEGLAALRELVRGADGLVEGYRPGVMERLGAGPDVLLADNPKLVYGRMTGWGQTGPYAQAAGHDINYIALSGVLHAIGRAGERPVPPLNLIGDFGGGGMLLAFAMVSALLAVRGGGDGQVIDCAMTDGAPLLNAMTYGMIAGGQWRDERGVNLLDGGAHFYDCYACADGQHIAVGAIEPPFYAELRRRIGIEADDDFDDQMNPACWPLLREKLAALFRLHPRAYWCALLDGTDACVTPVLSLLDAPHHPHNAARGTFIEVGGVLQPAPAPRYSSTACDRPSVPARR